MINFDKIDLNRLYYFYYVATCKNITRGAQEANIHQSGMTRHMMALEKEIGTKLLNRHSEGVTLTRAGEELFGYAQRIAREVGAIRKQLDEKDKVSGKIRICSTNAIMNYIIAEPLLEFQKLYPNIELELVGNDHVIDLVKSNVDVVIRPYDSITEGIIQEPIFKLHSKLYASHGYIEKNGYPETAEDLKNHKFISRSRTEMLPFDSSSVNWFLNIEGYTSEKNCIFKTNVTETRFLAAEKGIGIISAYSNMSNLKKSNLVHVARKVQGPEYNAHFVYPKQLESMRRIHSLKEHLKSTIN